MKKKAAIDISLTEVMGLVLAGIFVVLIVYAAANFTSLFLKGDQKTEATKNNYMALYNKIRTLDDGQEIDHPIYIHEGYVVFGFQDFMEGHMGGECNIWDIRNTYISNAKKPEACGEKSCLCLCKSKPDVQETKLKVIYDEDACSNPIICNTFDDIKPKGLLTSEQKCSFAIVPGKDEIQVIKLMREGEKVRVVTEGMIPAGEFDSGLPP